MQGLQKTIPSSKPLLLLGIILILLSLIFNHYLLQIIFYPGANIEILTKFLIWSLQVVLLFAGFAIIKFRHSFRFSKSFFINICLMLATILISLTAAEVVLRIMGRKPWKVNPNNIIVEPGGKLFLKHHTLGYTQRPGEFKITLATGYTFTATHDAKGHRITHPISNSNTKKKTKIWIFGDSMNYGWSLNDDEVYPWFLQDRLKEYEITNFGVNGYGTLHSYIQFKEELEKGKKPKIAIINYGSFHDRRNTLLRERKKLIAGPWNNIGLTAQPYARFDSEGKLEYNFSETKYSEFPLMRSPALAHLLERMFNQLEEKIYKSHDVTKAIIKDFAKLAKENNVIFVVAGIWWDPLTKEMLEFCKSEEILAVDISINLDLPGKRNYPHDDHPVSEVHREYSNMLELYLRENGLINTHS
jgi:hypothetical protein